MSTKPNYFKLGMFVIFTLALIIAGVIVLGSGILREEKFCFETYFDNSVSGLTVGSPVESRGVRIGKVESITFVTHEYELPKTKNGFSQFQKYVRVVCSADMQKIPQTAKKREDIQRQIDILIENGFRLQMASNLLTGQAFLDAVFLDSDKYPPLEIAWQPEHIYIPSAPGVITSLKASVENILSELEKLELKEINDKISSLLTTMDKTVQDANIPQLTDQLTGLLAEARETNKSLQNILKAPQEKEKSANLPETIAQLNASLKKINKLLTKNDPKIAEIMRNIRILTADLKQVISDLKQSPSDLIFTKPPEKSEVLK